MPRFAARRLTTSRQADGASGRSESCSRPIGGVCASTIRSRKAFEPRSSAAKRGMPNFYHDVW